MKHIILLLMTLCVCQVEAQVRTQTENIIVVTLDGFRWQELFRGADPSLTVNAKYVLLPDSVMQFDRGNSSVRREALLPFFWKTIASEGQLYGNRALGNEMNCSNPYWFSYPGYHELLVGAVDRKVCSNAKIINPNSTVLEFLLEQPEIANSIAAFATWDVFPYILREARSGIPVNAGTELVNWARPLTSDETKMNHLLETRCDRTDSITFHLALEYLKNDRPKVLYIALDETDHFAHADRYDQYLMAAHRADVWIGNLWNWIQQDVGYQDKTTLIITTDHGRGQNSKKTWRHHGRLTWGSGQIWMAALGPDTPHDGEMQTHDTYYQKQIAATIASVLGYQYQNDFPVGQPIPSVLRTPSLIAEANAPGSGPAK